MDDGKFARGSTLASRIFTEPNPGAGAYHHFLEGDCTSLIASRHTSSVRVHSGQDSLLFFFFEVYWNGEVN